jgi:hypothetical protein
MERLLTLAGNLAAVAGVLACLVAGAIRFAGVYAIGGFAMMTLFTVGIGLMTMGILAKLHAIGGSLQR